MLRVQDLGYWYQNPEDYLFQKVNLEFEAGKVYGILGSSGSGKTTFLSLISGLDAPKAGEIFYRDQAIQKMGLRNYRRAGVSIIFQAYNLLPYMTAIQNVETAMSLSVKKEKKGNAKEIAREALLQVGLTEKQISQPVVQLSGGQQQRVAIVRSLCCQQDIIIADEPTGNLDEKTSSEIVQLFQEMAHQQGKCVIIVTHETEVAQACDEVYELKKKAFAKKEFAKVEA